MDAEILIRLLLRFILVPLGAAAAIAAGVAIIVIADHKAVVTLLEAGPQAQEEYFTAVMFGGPLLAVLLSIWAFYTFVPAMVGVLISEALSMRSWTYHSANGGVSAWLGWALTRGIRDEYRFLTEPGILIAAGLVGGLVYWSIAGRTAGFRKAISPEPPPPALPS